MAIARNRRHEVRGFMAAFAHIEQPADEFARAANLVPASARPRAEGPKPNRGATKEGDVGMMAPARLRAARGGDPGASFSRRG